MKMPPGIGADRLAVIVAATLALVGVGWAGWSERTVTRVARPVPPLEGRLPQWDLALATPEEAERRLEVWRAPEPSATGWGFDLFTPPVVYYDRDSRRYTVSPAQVDAAEPQEAAAMGFGVSLLEVQREAYPLQLVGFAGEAGNYLGIFQNEKTGDGVVARAGHRFSDLGLELRSLEVRREDTIVPESMPLRETVAVAEIWDEIAGRLVRLSSAGWQWREAPIAQVRLEATGEVRALQAGDRMETDAATFEIHAVTASPVSALVVKHHRDGTREEMILRPDRPAEPQLKGDSPF